MTAIDTDPLRPPETDEEPWPIASDPEGDSALFLQFVLAFGVIAFLAVIVRLALSR